MLMMILSVTPALNNPVGPAKISRMAVSSETMMMIIPVCRIKSDGVRATGTAYPEKAVSLPLVRLYAIKVYPASKSRLDMGIPIVPRPIQPIDGFIVFIVDCVVLLSCDGFSISEGFTSSETLTISLLSWILDLGSWFLDLLSFVLVLLSWFLDLGSWILVLGSFVFCLGSWILVLYSHSLPLIPLSSFLISSSLPLLYKSPPALLFR